MLQKLHLTLVRTSRNHSLSRSAAYYALTRPAEAKIGSCGVKMFLLRKGPDGGKIFQIAATSRTDGCRAIVK